MKKLKTPSVNLYAGSRHVWKGNEFVKETVKGSAPLQARAVAKNQKKSVENGPEK